MRKYTNLSRFELARLISARAIQIGMGAPIFVKISKDFLEKIHYDPVEIARREFEEGKIPVAIVRK